METNETSQLSASSSSALSTLNSVSSPVLVNTGSFKESAHQIKDSETPVANESARRQSHYPVMREALKALLTYSKMDCLVGPLGVGLAILRAMKTTRKELKQECNS